MVYKTKRSKKGGLKKNILFSPRVQKKYEIEAFKKNGYAGIHILADFWFCKKVEKKSEIKKILITASKEAKAIPLETYVYKFKPQGLTGVVLLSESHIAIHTWPEIGYIAIDIFTCGDKSMPERALQYLKKEFSPKKIKIKKSKRGEKK